MSSRAFPASGRDSLDHWACSGVDDVGEAPSPRTLKTTGVHRLLALITHTIQFLGFHALVRVIDRLKAQVRALVLELKAQLGSRRFQNDSARLHPMHIHGQFFKVIARNGAPADEPYFRDTVLLRGRETIDVGMIPFDRGSWMMHCHILEHAESGMMTIIEVDGSGR